MAISNNISINYAEAREKKLWRVAEEFMDWAAVGRRDIREAVYDKDLDRLTGYFEDLGVDMSS